MSEITKCNITINTYNHALEKIASINKRLDDILKVKNIIKESKQRMELGYKLMESLRKESDRLKDVKIEYDKTSITYHDYGVLISQHNADKKIVEYQLQMCNNQQHIDSGKLQDAEEVLKHICNECPYDHGI